MQTMVGKNGYCFRNEDDKLLTLHVNFPLYVWKYGFLVTVLVKESLPFWTCDCEQSLDSQP